eukprot:COSAG01_NODE_1581_length_9827_cov_12.794613_7_plen_167_part_00
MAIQETLKLPLWGDIITQLQSAVREGGERGRRIVKAFHAISMAGEGPPLDQRLMVLEALDAAWSCTTVSKEDKGNKELSAARKKSGQAAIDVFETLVDQAICGFNEHLDAQRFDPSLRRIWKKEEAADTAGRRGLALHPFPVLVASFVRACQPRCADPGSAGGQRR